MRTVESVVLTVSLHHRSYCEEARVSLLASANVASELVWTLKSSIYEIGSVIVGCLVKGKQQGTSGLAHVLYLVVIHSIDALPPLPVHLRELLARILRADEDVA